MTLPDELPQSDPAGGPPPRPGGLLRSPWLAAVLGLLLVALVWVAAGAPLPGRAPTPSTSPSPSASVEPTSTCCASAEPSPSPTFVRPTPTPEPTFLSYVVKGGDSLTSIARRYETTPRSLAWWNREAYPSLDPLSEGYDPNHIEPGWVLVLLPGVEFDESAAPTRSPGDSTPGPSTAPTPTLPPQGGPAVVVSHGTRGTNQIALTFDMGGRLDPALDIVNWLIDHGVHATLFPTGVAGTTTDVGRAALLLAKAHPELFKLGNHSWSHPNFTTLTAAEMADQLTSTETAVAGLTGWTTDPWFRPPYGAWNTAVRTGVGAAGWPYLVMWDIDTIDWKATADGGPTASDIVTKVVSQAQGGSIVLMHLGGWHTFEALPGLVDGLKAKGLQPVTLQEMLKP
jgi:peptidoglycan/xylan/chitin deacetylase (PgdA/CDA1 family)